MSLQPLYPIGPAMILDTKQCPLNMTTKLHPPKSVLVQSEDLAVFSETEIRTPSIYPNPPQKHTTRRPNVNSVTTSTVNITVKIAFDTVRDPRVRHGK